jgi:hypothetical protein
MKSDSDLEWLQSESGRGQEVHRISRVAVCEKKNQERSGWRDFSILLECKGAF